MRRLLHIVMAVLLIGAAVPALFAGGRSEAKSDVRKIEFWGYADNRNQWLEAIAGKFEQETGSEVSILSMPFAQVHDQLQTALVSGIGAPDIADINIYQFGRFTRGERTGFVALNDYLTSEILQNLYASAALDPWSADGVYYGLGNELNPTFMYYRWDLLEEAGIEMPITTWEEFTAAGIQYVERTGKKFVWVHPQMWQEWWILAMSGKGFFNADGDVAFDDVLGRRVLQMMQDWIYKYEIAGIAPLDGPAQYGALGADDFAVLFRASWFGGFLKDNIPQLSGKWMMQEHPVFADGLGAPTGAIGGTAMVITEQSANPDLAWELIAYANLSTENLAAAFQRFNLFPTYRPMWDDPALYQSDPYFNNQKPGEWIGRAGQSIPSYNPSPFWPEVSIYFQEYIVNPVVLGEMSADQAMDAGIRGARNLLEDY